MTRRQLLLSAPLAAWAAERKNRAPLSRETLTVTMPAAEPVKLANGVTLIALEDNRLPIATISIRIEGAGTIYSPRPGVAELTADLLREGAAGQTGKQIVEAAARLGATLTTSASPGAETAGGDAAGLSSGWPQWFSLLCNLMLQPSFPADDFAGSRQRWMMSQRLRNSQAPSLADDTVQHLIYGNHPAAITMPPAAALAALTTEMLSSWHRERYTPSNTVVLCVGRIRASAFHAQAERLLGAWKGPEVKATLPPNPPLAAARRIVLIDRPGAAQTEIAIGGLLFDRRDPDFHTMPLLNTLLGGGTGSRLYQILHEEKGYAYNVSSVYAAPRFTGFWRVRAGVRTDTTADSIAIILEQLRRLCEEPVTDTELDAVKRAAAGSFALTLEQPQQVVTNSYLRYRYGFSPDYWERYPAKLNAVTPSEIQSVARKYFDPQRALIVAAGDAARIRPALAKLGPLESVTP